MLWIIEGTHSLAKTKEIEKIKNQVSPDIVIRYDSISPEVSFLKDSQDLFGEKKLVVVSEAVFLDFSKDIESYSVSPHTFVFCIPKILAPEKKELKNTPIIKCVAPAQEKVNLFDFTDVFLTKNKKNIWVSYQKKRREGVSVQEIVPILIWQVKTLLLVLMGEEKDAEIKPYTVTKAKKALKNFTQPMLMGYIQELVSMYHNKRRGKDLENNFERFILNL